MAYTDFKTLRAVEEILHVSHQETIIFDDIKPCEPSALLKEILATSAELPIKSEKSRSEAIVFPLLMELIRINNKKITIYSGDNLNADAALGLRGECDFVITKTQNSREIKMPILQIVEAKKNDLDLGISQCAAQMIGADMFNKKYDPNTAPKAIYGCATTGTEWIFLKLTDNQIFIHKRIFYLQEISYILGVFQMIIDEYKDILD